MSLEEKFKSACDQARNFKKRPADGDVLELYGLYKQATVGDVNKAKPSDSEGAAKWNAWNSKKGLAAKYAKEQYIANVNTLAPNHS
ncbi:unnamed protein product [Acanthoscelides obtectus]|uniref:ACB domain-containing protein n=1 Tax=Acanthoscelides obtectus TaxID=200917 RepID=A0A9P0L1G8_ACAOB|nr:unnamed protein product [Acanthoscelides obtectus]CAK1624636.1 hypothetical protein AOBTE_LOCUS2667 [Acanthoscelides obtectus]